MIDLAYIKVIFYKNKISKIKFVGENKQRFFFTWLPGDGLFPGNAEVKILV